MQVADFMHKITYFRLQKGFIEIYESSKTVLYFNPKYLKELV